MYASPIHCNSDADAEKCSCSVGMATFRTVLSRPMIRRLSERTARVHQRRRYFRSSIGDGVGTPVVGDGRVSADIVPLSSHERGNTTIDTYRGDVQSLRKGSAGERATARMKASIRPSLTSSRDGGCRPV